MCICLTAADAYTINTPINEILRDHLSKGPYGLGCCLRERVRMRTITEVPRSIPVLAEVDVLVVGGGPSGLAAAIAAAREGMDTMLLDRYGCFGGVISQVGVEPIAWYRHENTVEAGGICTEIEQTAKSLGATSKEVQSDSEAIDAEMFKYVCDRLVTDVGVQAILHCYAVSTIADDNTVVGVVTESKSGRNAIIAKRTIDCTGDGDVAAFAGVPYYKAPKDELMAVTQMFSCRGVDKAEFEDYVYNVLKPTYRDWGGESWGQETLDNGLSLFSPYMEEAFIQAQKDGCIPKEEGISIGGTWSTVSEEGDITQLNMVFIRNIDCTNVHDLTWAEMKGREHAIYAIKALNKYVPGFQKARLRNFGMTLGTRESRRIEGHYFLTEHDVKNQAQFDDSIGIFPEFIDGRGMIILPLTGRYFQVPYRALVPKNRENLLVAGRAISGDQIAHCAYRNISCCILTGQAAGVAAAVSIKNSEVSSQVNITDVQGSLLKQGVRIK